MQSHLDQLKSDFQSALAKVADASGLEAIRNEYLGRRGKLSAIMKQMKDLAAEERAAAGALANEAKALLEAAYAAKQTELGGDASARAGKEWIDVTEPGVWPGEGHLHPVSTAIAEVTALFSAIGFSRVSAPEIDWDYYAFESLNMPADHPARDDWETFFVAGGPKQKATGDKGRLVLTPHTSNSQVREMEKGILPIRMININRTYRRQSDITHVPMFHQFEGLMIAEGLTIADLKGVLDYFAKGYFGEGRAVRLRPHHFRFTEPSFEIDISCDICRGEGDIACRLCKSGWLELGGAGMVHPNVLKAGGVDTEKYSGFAFGWGVERSLMMKEGIAIDDIRVLYRNDLRFVTQF